MSDFNQMDPWSVSRADLDIMDGAMRLFIAKDVLTDWTHGMIVVAAPDADSISDVILAHENKDGSRTFDEDDYIEGTYIDHGWCEGPARVISYVYGGG